MWLAGGLVLLVIELVTPSGFFVMFFGLGAMTVGILQRLGLTGEAWTEWLIFSVTSIVYLLLFRGRLQDRMEQPSGLVDTIVGELATPKERIGPGEVGRVELRGATWNARNETGTPLEPGQRCRVSKVDGLMVTVRPE